MEQVIETYKDGVLTKTERRTLTTEEQEYTIARQRKAAYPDIGEQLDEIWKVLGELDKVINNVPSAKAVLSKINKVKADFPKPR